MSVPASRAAGNAYCLIEHANHVCLNPAEKRWKILSGMISGSFLFNTIKQIRYGKYITAFSGIAI
jgi:hypothetical protein